MTINYPLSLPEGFSAPDYPFDLTTNHSDEARAFIRDGGLLFRLYNFSDEVQVIIELSDDGGNGSLGPPGIVVAARNGGTRFVHFSRLEQSICRYRITAQNQRSPRDGAHLGVQIYTHR